MLLPWLVEISTIFINTGEVLHLGCSEYRFVIIVSLKYSLKILLHYLKKNNKKLYLLPQMLLASGGESIVISICFPINFK